MNFGATTEEWEHFRRELGADILPTVCDPNAVGTPNSKIKSFGKIPSLYASDGKAFGFHGFVTYKSSEKDVEKWKDDGRLGICMVARTVRVLDVDVDDVDLAEAIEKKIFEALGPLPTRIGAFPKRSYFFHIRQHKPEPKRIMRLDGGHIIEFLADRQHSVIAGRHKNGARYTWVNGLPQGFPVVDIERLADVWDLLAKVYGKEPNTFNLDAGLNTRPKPLHFTQQEDPIVAFLQTKGVIADQLPDGRVFVTCPWEAEHTTDSGPSATIYFPLGYNGHNRPGFKCLHGHCEHRNVSDFLTSLDYQQDNAEDFEVLVVGQDGLPELVRTKGGKPEPRSFHNIVALVRTPAVCGLDIRYDAFIADISVSTAGAGAWRPLEDVDYAKIKLSLERLGVYANREGLRDAVAMVAQENEVDTAKIWLSSLVWDGVPRVSTFGTRVLKAMDCAYTTAVAEYMWTAMAARVMAPGCQAEMVPVFVGAQGNRKTSTIKALLPGPEYYVEIDLQHRDDNLARMLRGKLVGELAEMKGLAVKGNEAIKAWVTRTHEEWVPKYKERQINYPRRTAFIGTSNPPRFLDDPTGERRWLPITVGLGGSFLDTEYVKLHREQLWAEAREMFLEGGVRWQAAGALAAPARAAAKVRDPWQPLINRWLDDNPGPVSPATLFISATQGLPSQFGRFQQMRIESCLRCYGYEEISPDTWQITELV